MGRNELGDSDDESKEEVANLGFYHASERLGDLCQLMKDQKQGKRRYGCWVYMLLD